MNAGNIIAAIAAAILFPVLLAMIVGIPVWIIARCDKNYVSAMDDYRIAVGLPAMKRFEWSFILLSQPKGLYSLAWILVLYLNESFPKLGFVGMVIGFSGTGLILVYCVWKSWRVLRQHPELEARLRKVPLTEIWGFSAAALMAFGASYFMVVIVAPEEFGGR